MQATNGPIRSMGARRNNQCGATFVETSIVFVVFLALALGLIDWGVIYSKRMLIRNAFYQAARAGAMQESGCTAAAQAEFNRQLDKFGGFLPRAVLTGQTTFIGASPAEIAGLELSASIRIGCVSCPFFPGASSKFTGYELRSFFPYQSQTLGVGGSCAAGNPN